MQLSRFDLSRKLRASFAFIGVLFGLSAYSQDFPDAKNGEIFDYLVEHHWFILEQDEVAGGYGKNEMRAHFGEMLDRQRTLLERLGQSKVFREGWESREGYLRIEVGKVEKSEREMGEISETALTEFKKFASTDITQVSENGKGKGFAAKLDHQISELVQWCRARGLNGFSVGLGTLLSKSKKAEFFQAQTVEEKIQILEGEEITDENVRKKFKAEAIGLESEKLTFDSLMEAYREADARHRTLLRLVLLRQLIKKREGKRISDYSKWVGGLGLEDFSFVPLRKENGLQLLPEVAEGKREKADTTLVEKLLKEYQAQAFQQRRVKHEESKPYVVVQEVPPFMGVLRGNVGGDCATSQSWGYVYSPYERVFFVYDAKGGNPRGYVSVTIVESDGKQVAYLKDLVGPRISARMGESVLYGFAGALKEMGVKKLVLPTINWVLDQNPHQKLQEMFEEYTHRESERVRLQFHDGRIRSRISEIIGIENGYDRPDLHREGVVFKPSKRFKKNIAVAVTQGASGFSLNAETPAKLVLPAVRAMMKDAKVKFKEDEIVREEIKTLVSLFRNERKFPHEEYQRQLKRRLLRFGLKFDAAMKKECQELMAIGRLRAVDAFAPEAKKRSRQNAQTVVEIIEAGDYERLTKIRRGLLREMGGSQAALDVLTEAATGWVKQENAEGMVRIQFLLGQGLAQVREVVGSEYFDRLEAEFLAELEKQLENPRRGGAEPDMIKDLVAEFLRAVKNSQKPARERQRSRRVAAILSEVGITQGQMQNTTLRELVAVESINRLIQSSRDPFEGVDHQCAAALFESGKYVKWLREPGRAARWFSRFGDEEFERVFSLHAKNLKGKKPNITALRFMMLLAERGHRKADRLFRDLDKIEMMRLTRSPVELAFLGYEILDDKKAEKKLEPEVIEILAKGLGRALRRDGFEDYRKYALEILLATDFTSESIMEALEQAVHDETGRKMRVRAIGAFLRRGGKPGLEVRLEEGNQTVKAFVKSYLQGEEVSRSFKKRVKAAMKAGKEVRSGTRERVVASEKTVTETAAAVAGCRGLL